MKEAEKKEIFRDKREVELEQLKNKPVFTRSRIKIKFPDNMVLVASFGAKETVQDIIALMKAYMLDGKREFYLFETPPKRVVKKVNAQLHAIKLVPSATLYFGWSDQ